MSFQGRGSRTALSFQALCGQPVGDPPAPSSEELFERLKRHAGWEEDMGLVERLSFLLALPFRPLMAPRPWSKQISIWYIYIYLFIYICIYILMDIRYRCINVHDVHLPLEDLALYKCVYSFHLRCSPWRAPPGTVSCTCCCPSASASSCPSASRAARAATSTPRPSTPQSSPCGHVVGT